MERKNDLGCKCFHCGETDHFVKACPWKNLPCVVDGCPKKMNIYWSKQQHSCGCRFVRCRGQPHCKAFRWIDDPNKATSSNGDGSRHVKVTVEEKGKRVTYKGNVNYVIELMNKKLM